MREYITFFQKEKAVNKMLTNRKSTGHTLRGRSSTKEHNN